MICGFDKIKNLPTYTKSGDFLGKIDGIEINCQTQVVARYIIKSSKIINRLTSHKLIVSASQVISLDNKKMVVEDSTIGNTRLARQGVAS